MAKTDAITEIKTNGQFEYRCIDSGTGIELVRFLDSSAADLDIPDEIDCLPVRVIGPGCFTDNGGLLTRVLVPDSVREIGKDAFSYCFVLESLELGRDVRRLGSGFLSFCGSIEHLTIPESVSDIDDAFILNALHIDTAEGGVYYSDGFGLYRRMGIGSDDDSGEDKLELVSVCQEEAKETYTLLPDTVSIGANAFRGQGYLKEVILPEGLARIGDSAFQNCSGINSFLLPASLREIGVAALETSGWDEHTAHPVTISAARENPVLFTEKNALYMREEPAHGGSLQLIRYFGDDTFFTVPEGVRVIRTDAFKRTDLSIVSLPSTLEEVQPGAFNANPRLTKFLFPSLGAEIWFPDVVFRKDDIESLFHPQAEKFVCFGKPLRFRADPGVCYQFAAYDALFDTYYGVEEKAVLAVCRLAFPVDLDENTQAMYQTWLSSHLEELMDEITKKENNGLFRAFLSLGVLDRERTDRAIEFCLGKRRTICLQMLLDYKHDRFAGNDDDFSL